MVFCLEGRSWRKDFYEPTKESAVVLDKRTEREKEEDDFWWEVFDNFVHL